MRIARDLIISVDKAEEPLAGDSYAALVLMLTIALAISLCVTTSASFHLCHTGLAGINLLGKVRLSQTSPGSGTF